MSDLISRQDAIELVEDIENKWLKGEIDLMYAPLIKGLQALPSADASLMQDRCKYDASSELISRAEAIAIATQEGAYGYISAEELAEMPSAERVGHWIDTGSGQECSVCQEIQYGYDTGRHYCPNCGSRNEVSKDD